MSTNLELGCCCCDDALLLLLLLAVLEEQTLSNHYGDGVLFCQSLRILLCVVDEDFLLRSCYNSSFLSLSLLKLVEKPLPTSLESTLL